MSDHTARGQADHRAVELFERLAIVAEGHGVTADRVERLITAEIVHDAAILWWTRRGYAMPADATHLPGGDSPATN
jgi:hypothetical protein